MKNNKSRVVMLCGKPYTLTEEPKLSAMYDEEREDDLWFIPLWYNALARDKKGNLWLLFWRSDADHEIDVANPIGANLIERTN